MLRQSTMSKGTKMTGVTVAMHRDANSATIKFPLDEGLLMASKSTFWRVEYRKGLRFALIPFRKPPYTLQEKRTPDGKLIHHVIEVPRTERTEWLFEKVGCRGFATVETNCVRHSDGVVWVGLPPIRDRRPVDMKTSNTKQLSLKL
jgi:hypothetical protein